MWALQHGVHTFAEIQFDIFCYQEFCSRLLILTIDHGWNWKRKAYLNQKKTVHLNHSKVLAVFLLVLVEAFEMNTVFHHI